MKGQAEGRTNEKDKPIAVPIDDPTRKPVLPIFALFCAILRQKKISKITKRTHLPKFKIPANTAISQHSLPPAPKNEPILLITPKKRARSLSILHSAFCLPPPPRRAEVQRRRIAFST